MDYQKIMCEFCKECKECKLNTRVVKVPYEHDVTIVKCENFCPKLTFKSNAKECCSFFEMQEEVDYIEFRHNDKYADD